jgi:hypothetical protein
MLAYNYTTTTQIIIRKSLHGKKTHILNKTITLSYNMITFINSNIIVMPMNCVTLLA